MMAEYLSLIEQYRLLAKNHVPSELYRMARAEGVSRGHTFFLLRDLYNFNLAECQETMREVGDEPASP